jgi:hypothetical protein
MPDPNDCMLTRTNKYIRWHRNIGFMPMVTLCIAKDYMESLVASRDSHFPRDDHRESLVREGKMHHVDRPQSTGTKGTLPME